MLMLVPSGNQMSVESSSPVGECGTCVMVFFSPLGRTNSSAPLFKIVSIKDPGKTSPGLKSNSSQICRPLSGILSWVTILTIEISVVGISAVGVGGTIVLVGEIEMNVALGGLCVGFEVGVDTTILEVVAGFVSDSHATIKMLAMTIIGTISLVFMVFPFNHLVFFYNCKFSFVSVGAV
jgi:hypothetical protein